MGRDREWKGWSDTTICVEVFYFRGSFETKCMLGEVASGGSGGNYRLLVLEGDFMAMPSSLFLNEETRRWEVDSRAEAEGDVLEASRRSLQGWQRGKTSKDWEIQ